MQYVWDLFVRVFHWSLVVAFAIAFITHKSEWHLIMHVNAGFMAGYLILARIAWGFLKTGYASFNAFPLKPIQAIKYVWEIAKGHPRQFIGHNPAGSLIIYLMLIIGLLTVSSGVLVFNDGWLIDAPDLLQSLHQFFAWTWLFLVCIHVLGVITESIVHKDNLIMAMITGVKRTHDSNRYIFDKNVSRETLHTSAMLSAGLHRVIHSLTNLGKLSNKLYLIQEEENTPAEFWLKKAENGGVFFSLYSGDETLLLNSYVFNTKQHLLEKIELLKGGGNEDVCYKLLTSNMKSMYFTVKIDDCLIAASPLFDSDSERMSALATIKNKLTTAKIKDFVE
jgi:cytochrome b